MAISNRGPEEFGLYLLKTHIFTHSWGTAREAAGWESFPSTQPHQAEQGLLAGYPAVTARGSKAARVYHYSTQPAPG